MLVTEKPGRLRIVAAGGTVSAPLAGVPPVYFDASAQGGLLDVALSRDFAASRILFFSYSEPYTAAGSRTAVARARFSDAGLTDVQVIFRQDQPVATGIHFGGRIVVAADGTLFIGVGERGERDRAPELGNTRGKVVRIAADGSIPADNPFVGRSGARGEVWSYGHRNPQGMTLEPGTGRLWLCEHGPLGGDELNIVQRGADYGWPRITYGREYDTGRPIGQGTSAPDVVAPVHYWVPTSIAPSGLAFYTGTRFPSWQGSVLTGALAGRALVRLRLQGDLVVSEERLLATQNERIRDVRMGPDGEVYLLTDAADGRLLTVVAA